MFGTHDLPLFAVTVFVLNVTPCVDLMLTLATTLKRGVRGGLLIATGICAGCVVHTLAAAFGLGALMAASTAACNAIKWLGAAYLLWLAIGMLREAGRHMGARRSTQAADGRLRGGSAALFAQGFLTNALDPKVALFSRTAAAVHRCGSARQGAGVTVFLGGWLIAQSWLSSSPSCCWSHR
jgi:threonine/homoserine/homoserine lactone efflux protein